MQLFRRTWLRTVAAIAAMVVSRSVPALAQVEDVWAWGANWAGQLGQGTTGGPSNAPAAVGTLSNVVAIAAGSSHDLALASDGTVWCIGRSTGRGSRCGRRPTTGATVWWGGAQSPIFHSGGHAESTARLR